MVSFVHPTVLLEAYILDMGSIYSTTGSNIIQTFFFLRIGHVIIENNQSDDLLAEQCHPQCNKVLRDSALIRSAEPLFFLFDNHLIHSISTVQIINTVAAKLSYNVRKLYLHHPYKRKLLLLS